MNIAGILSYNAGNSGVQFLISYVGLLPYAAVQQSGEAVNRVFQGKVHDWVQGVLGGNEGRLESAFFCQYTLPYIEGTDNRQPFEPPQIDTQQDSRPPHISTL